MTSPEPTKPARSVQPSRRQRPRFTPAWRSVGGNGLLVLRAARVHDCHASCCKPQPDVVLLVVMSVPRVLPRTQLIKSMKVSLMKSTADALKQVDKAPPSTQQQAAQQRAAPAAAASRQEEPVADGAFGREQEAAWALPALSPTRVGPAQPPFLPLNPVTLILCLLPQGGPKPHPRLEALYCIFSALAAGTASLNAQPAVSRSARVVVVVVSVFLGGGGEGRASTADVARMTDRPAASSNSHDVLALYACTPLAGGGSFQAAAELSSRLHHQAPARRVHIHHGRQVRIGRPMRRWGVERDVQ